MVFQLQGVSGGQYKTQEGEVSRLREESKGLEDPNRPPRSCLGGRWEVLPSPHE